MAPILAETTSLDSGVIARFGRADSGSTESSVLSGKGSNCSEEIRPRTGDCGFESGFEFKDS